MFLSPLTWGTNDLVEDFLSTNQSDTGDKLSVNSSCNFKAKRIATAKLRNEEPKFVSILRKITSACPPQPYFPNPLAKETSRSKLCSYVEENFVWEAFPKDVDVGIGDDGHGGQLPASRVTRKRQQLDNIMAFVVPFLLEYGSHSTSSTRRKVVVDFCCGCGHQSIPLAYLFPNVRFILIDTNDVSLEIARKRVQSLQLTNVTIISNNIKNFNEDFDVGISLHACGIATDIAIQKSTAARAVYISIPCCVGKISHHDSNRLDRESGGICYPRSQMYISIGCTLHDYLRIAKAADFGHHGYDEISHNVGGAASTRRVSTDKAKYLMDSRRLSKRVIEHDRNLYAKENKYVVYMSICHPLSCTPKNDILIGIPSEMETSISCFTEWIGILS